MSEQEKSTRRFVVDTNVFVAAIKPFTKPAQQSHSDTKTLALLIKLINDEKIELFANFRLIEEYRELAEALSSKTGSLILQQLTAKTKTIEADGEAVSRCKPYLPKNESADIIHAATCLKTNAILISNGKDFDEIRRSELITVWKISEAIRRLLKG